MGFIKVKNGISRFSTMLQYCSYSQVDTGYLNEIMHWPWSSWYLMKLPLFENSFLRFCFVLDMEGHLAAD